MHDLQALRASAEERNHSPQSLGSAGSHRNRAESEATSLASVILHYMPGIDAENSSDLLASRYYGNMALLSGDVDRRPLPMNSTLPLFSPSVIHGRIAPPRGRSSRASGSGGASPQRLRGSESATKLLPAGSQESPALPGPTAAAPDSARPVAPAPIIDVGVTEAVVPPVDEAHVPEQPVPGSPGETVSEKADGLGIDALQQPLHQLRARRSQFIGTTQYTPAAAHKRSAIARAAPGMSYMFSPTVGGSRPPSVSGMATLSQPPPLQPLTPCPRAQSELPGGAAAQPEVPVPISGHARDQMNADSTRSGDNRLGVGAGLEDAQLLPEAGARASSTFGGEHAVYGAVNIGTLQRFLEEGKVPDSSSSDDSGDGDDGSDDGTGWEEDDDVPAVPQVDRHATPLAHMSVSGREAGMASPLLLSPALRANRLSPRVHSTHSTRYMPTPDERTPLIQPLTNAAPEYLVPADLPAASNLSVLESLPPPARESSGPSPGSQESQPTRRRRRRRSHRNHEELFLDKDGFIDESYRFTFFNPAIGTIRAQEFADLRTPTMDLAALLQVGGCFWIDVLRPSFQEMHLLSKVFGIHALTVEDVMTQDVREKCEIHANYYFVCFRSFDSDPASEEYLEPKCIYNVVMREGIITFHMDPSVHQYHVLRRIRRQIDHIVVTPDWLNYAMIDDITDLLAPILHSVEFDVDAIDELVLVITSSEQSDMLLRISTVRKRIMMAMRLLQGKADVVRALIKRFESATAISTTQMTAMAGAVPERTVPATSAGWCESPRLRNPQLFPDYPEAADLALDRRKGQETLLYLGDVLDHVVTMMQNATHYDNMLGRAQTNYLAQISIELTESSNNTNDVVAKLSALAAIVVPLNFITGMWGANVKVPGQDYDSLHFFFYILAMCGLYVVGAIACARYYKIF
ncbi:CorA metal ion transporter [Coemansia helicoidea]|uniref:CorA metal ion transporter n=1 Tax=Coemansia helicoidea TaxID=1286919 RepID=A0ACC1LF57_9FUNG|nr:CorA metal ion transporter [Coemansia helicoidea]